MDTNSPDLARVLERAVRNALNEEIERIVTEEKLAVAKRINDRVRELIPKIGVALLNRFTIEQPFGRPELVIRVDLNETPNSNS